MKRAVLVGAVAFLTSCTPDIEQDPSDDLITVEFNPAAEVPVVPTPNDLALQGERLVIPCAPGTTPETDAQCELNQNYLTGLDGYPMESTATALTSAPIDPATVNAGTVIVLDLGVYSTPPSAPTPVTTAAPTTNERGVVVPAPAGGWLRSHRYAVAIVGGANGVKGVDGQQVAGSAAFALIRQEGSLVTGEGCNFPTETEACVPATSLITSTARDINEQFEENRESALQLEGLRRGYKPLLDGLAAIGIARPDVASLWTFRITRRAEVTFDPANSVIPFPNDLLRTAEGRVNLPVPANASPTLQALIGGLNSLDGFSTTAPAISESGDAAGALVQGAVEDSEANLAVGPTRNINFVALDSKGLPGPAPVVRACINCTVSPTLPDTTPKPQLLQIVPQVPLTERTRYAAYVTTGLRDASGETVIPSPAFALFRSANRLVDDEGRSTVSVLSDAQAAALEPARAAYQPVFDALQAQGVPRKNLALAWAYTTQSTISTLVELHGAPYAAPGLPSTPLWAADLPIPGGVPRTSIDAAYQGEIVDLFGLVSANATFNPGLQGATPRPLPFVMTVPTGTAPAAGWPVVLFGHGLTGNRTNLLAIANALAARGFVSIAIDEPWHGERNTCTGFGAYLSAAASAPAGTFQDDRACADPATQSCNAVGRCQADTRPVTECAYGTPAANQVCTTAGLGQCAPDGRCEGASFATAVTLGPVSVPVSGWNLLNLANLFALRDNFRQQVISFSQLARVVRDTASPGNLGAVTEATPINPNLVHYAGGSLGGILGTLFTAAAPEISSVVLNVPGADLRTILFTSPAFAPLASGFVAGLEAQGIGRDTPAFDTFINWAKWILDPADPANAAYYTANAATLPAPIASPARRTFVQWIEDDQVIPNPATVALVRAALSRPDATGDRDANVPAGFFDELYSGAEVAAVSACTRHGFLFSPPSAANSCEPGGSIAGGLLTQAAQAQVGLFLSGSAPY